MMDPNADNEIKPRQPTRKKGKTNVKEGEDGQDTSCNTGNDTNKG